MTTETNTTEPIQELHGKSESSIASALDIDEADYAKMRPVLNLIFDWLVAKNLNDKRCLKSIGMRVLAATWVIDPSRFENRSLHNIALELGFGPNNIAPYTADFSRRFGITNQFQSHNWRTKGKSVSFTSID